MANNRYKIFNGTPHPVNIVEWSIEDPAIIKFKGGTVIATVPPNYILNAKFGVENIGEFNGIPLSKKTVEGCDPLPEGYDIYIVSALYAIAYRELHGYSEKIFSISDLVVEDDGKTP